MCMVKDVLRIKAWAGVPQIEEGAKQQAGADEQNEGERNLGDHECVAKGGAHGAARESGGDATGGCNGRRETKADPGGHADSAEKGEDPPVEADFRSTRDLPCGEAQEEAAAQHSERKTGDAPGEGKQEALGEELTGEPEAAGTDRGANSDLAGARSGAGQQEVRDVEAGDEQHHADGAEQHQQ